MGLGNGGSWPQIRVPPNSALNARTTSAPRKQNRIASTGKLSGRSCLVVGVTFHRPTVHRIKTLPDAAGKNLQLDLIRIIPIDMSAGDPRSSDSSHRRRLRWPPELSPTGVYSMPPSREP